MMNLINDTNDKLNNSEKNIIKGLSNTEKSIVKLSLVSLFQYEKKIIDFKEVLLTKQLENISIYDFPFVNVESYNKFVSNGVRTAKDLITIDFADLVKFASEDELKEVCRFADTAYVYIEAGLIEGY